MDKIFRQWTASYQNPVWSLARYLLNDSSEAEDVAQEAFIKLWQHRESMEEERVKPWLLRVTRNLCLDRLRRRRPETGLEDSEIMQHPGPQEGMQHSELAQCLQRAVEQLQEPYRSLVILRDIQQHSYDEVAGVTQLNLAQVKTYLHRARKQLRQQLAELLV
jgi:RNA polymerase sigma-70 factor, ECF subfamily